MNLSYEVTNDELLNLFGKFGKIESIEIPLRKGGKGVALGIAYITFKETEGAITAFATLDKTFF
jgi:RNA recognition motif-containing protein